MFFVSCLSVFVEHRASGDPLQLDLLRDGILLGVGLPYAGLSEYLVRSSGRDTLGAPDRDEINAFDRSALFDYSKGLNVTGDLLMFTTILAPASYGFFLSSRDIVTSGVIYVETLLLANGAKNTLKYLIPRYRPYVYSGGAPDVDSREDDQSFPSGDSTMAFAAATAGVYMFSIYFPQSPWLVPLAAGAYGLATLTATLRVVAGMHFMTDVATGAILGTVVGYAIPMLHRSARARNRSDGLSVNVLPDRLVLTFRY